MGLHRVGHNWVSEGWALSLPTVTTDDYARSEKQTQAELSVADEASTRPFLSFPFLSLGSITSKSSTLATHECVRHNIFRGRKGSTASQTISPGSGRDGSGLRQCHLHGNKADWLIPRAWTSDLDPNTGSNESALGSHSLSTHPCWHPRLHPDPLPWVPHCQPHSTKRLGRGDLGRQPHPDVLTTPQSQDTLAEKQRSETCKQSGLVSRPPSSPTLTHPVRMCV